MTIIPVIMMFDRNYIVAAKVAIYSLLKHASRQYHYNIYILHTTLTPKDRKKISRSADGFPADIHFMNVSSYDEYIMSLSSKGHFSKEIFYKLIAAELFPQYDRIICTDVDVVFKNDVSPSFFIEPEEPFFFAGTGQIIESNRMSAYTGKFNEEEINVLRNEIAAGYMIINLKAIREHNMQPRLVDYYTTNYSRFNLPEQDCIALCCWPHIAYLPMKYVVLNTYYPLKDKDIKFFPGNKEFEGDKETALKHFKETLDNPTQLHFVGSNKPWNSFGVPQQHEWFAYMKESGCTLEYIMDLPRQYANKLKRLSLKRFYKKAINSLNDKCSKSKQTKK